MRAHDRSASLESGAAAAEMAILMLVLVPTILYSMWVVDALTLKLDVQEAVSSTGWDYTVARYDWDKKGAPPDANTIQSNVAFDKFNRKVWCDLTAAYDTPSDAPADCTGDGAPHHRRWIAAHMLWEANGGGNSRANRGVKCTLNRDVGQPQLTEDLQAATLPMNPFAVAKNLWTNGGLWTCEGTGRVYNYLIPKSFYQEFTQTDLANEAALKNLHDSYDGGAGVEGKYNEGHIKIRSKFAVLTDTWAMTDAHDRKLKEGCWSAMANGEAKYGPYKRVKDVYSGDITDPGNSNPVMLVAAGAQAIYMAQSVSKGGVVVRPPTFCLEGTDANAWSSAGLGTDATALPLSMRSHDPAASDSMARAPGRETLYRPLNKFLPVLTTGDDFITSPWQVSGSSDAGYRETFNARGAYYMGCKTPQKC